jgi:hypothetical protein
MTEKERINIPEDQLEGALLSGDVSFGQNEVINMFDSDGNLVGVKGPDVPRALQQGFKIESNRQAAIRRYVDSKDNLKGSVEVALKQFADEAAFGIPELIAEKKANPFEVEKWQALKERHDTANTLGGLTGFGASFLVGGPVYKAGTAAGKAAEKVIASKLAQYGVERGSKSVAADLLARTAQTGGNLAVDAIVSSAPRTITEAALGDYEAAAESLLLNGGIGLILGGAGGAAKGVFDRTKQAATNYFNKMAQPGINIDDLVKNNTATAKEFGKEAGAVAPSELAKPNDVIGILRANNADEGLLASVTKEFSKLKKNSKDIVEAFQKLKVKPEDIPEDWLSDSTALKTLVQSLDNRPDPVGFARTARKDAAWRAMEDAATQVLRTTTDDVGSAFAIGTKIKTELVQKIDDVLKAQEEVFTQLNINRSLVEVSEKPLRNAINTVKDLPEFRLSGMKGIVSSFQKAIDDGVITNLDDLAKFRTGIAQSVGPTSAGNDKFVAQQLVKYLDDVEERTINKAFERSLKSAAKDGADPITLGALWKQRQEANKGYRELAESLSEEADALGFTSRNPYDFKRKLENMTAEDFVKKFSVKNDVAALETLAQKYPEQFDLIRDFIKKNIYEKSIYGDRLSAKKVVDEIEKLTPEFQNRIFGESEREAIKILKTATRAVAKNENPSGTAKMLEYMNIGNIGNLLRTGKSYLEDRLIASTVNVEGILQTDKMINKTRANLDRVNQIVKDLGSVIKKSSVSARKASVIGIERLFEDEPNIKERRKEEVIKKIQQLNEKSNEFVLNPNLMIEKVTEIVSGLSETGAPTVAAAFGAKAQNMIGYIADNVPKPKTVPNVFMNRPYQPSSQEISQFERKMAVLADPFVVIDALADNSLTKEHVESLSANYPKLYEAIQYRIFDTMVKEKPELPYQARLKLSLLMGADVDNSLSSIAIKGLQDAWSFAQTPEQDSGLNQAGLMKLGENEMTATESQRMMMRT